LLEHVARPEDDEGRLRLALSHARTGNDAEVRLLADFLVGEDVNRPNLAWLDVDVASDRVCEFFKLHPQSLDQVREVLEFIGVGGIETFVGRDWGVPYIDIPAAGSDDPDSEDDYGEDLDGEVGYAYCVLAKFHARRGGFSEAESLAFQAAAVGESDGLVDLSDELLEKGDRAAAERLALSAVNMEDAWMSNSTTNISWSALAEARGDEALLVWGLNADGTTAEPW
jgi:hypothetical protein